MMTGIKYKKLLIENFYQHFRQDRFLKEGNREMAEKKKNTNAETRVERVNDAEERKKALAAALSYIEKEFGKGSIMRMGEGTQTEDVEVVSTGSLGLDLALGVGGLPRGRIVEIYGPESSGKTTLTLHIIAEMQKMGGTCAFIDAEHCLLYTSRRFDPSK